MTQSEALILQAIEKLSQDVAEIRALLGAPKPIDNTMTDYSKLSPRAKSMLNRAYDNLADGTMSDFGKCQSFPKQSQPSPYSE